MNPSYLRLRRSLEDAIMRYGAWIKAPELGPPQEVAEAMPSIWHWRTGNGRGWRCTSSFSGPWTVFEELSGGLGARPAEDWVTSPGALDGRSEVGGRRGGGVHGTGARVALDPPSPL